ncbi:LANO_0D08284g1_1 [Lachancea nothofagi CBS 11611]|uniref:LANO_0D08284g1_1 n=1 Tax=Lachancea nothofagi CBS 11611 TaxID=1266666 RepID=A0A1G4JJ17_9SACH|nr:LANO_0D08284g1_1 [Lachancea nothofagi CBS 11611]
MNSTNCEYGLRPYPDQTTNALNPCFLSAVSLGHSMVFGIIGIFQLVQLIQEKRVPPKFKYSSLWRSMSTKHIMHLSNVGLQAVLFLCLVALSPLESTTSIAKLSALSQLLFVLLISVPTQTLQYYKSTASLAGQLFYYSTQFVLFGYQIGQRVSHFPDTRFNVYGGQYGAILEIALMLNALSIFSYDLLFFNPSKELISYYSENKLYPECNIFENLTFTWMNKLIVQVYHDGEIKDPHKMPLPPINLNVKEKAGLLNAKWEKEKWKGRNSLLWAIIHAFGKTLALALTFEIIKNFMTILQPQLLRLFIDEFNQDESRSHPMINAVFVAIALFLMKLISTCLSNQFFITIFEAGMGIRGSLMTMLYQKSLTLSAEAREEKSAGDILNLMAVDVLRIQRFFETSQDIIGSPLALVTTLISLYTFLGYATLGGVVVMAVMFPINSYLSRKIKTYVKTQMKYKDARIKTVTEILNSVKTVKLYAWEEPMLKRLNHVRNDLELGSAKKIAIVTNLTLLAWNCVPILVASSTFLIYAITMNRPLSPEIVFPSLSLFDILNDCIYTIPRTITNFIETGVSLGRLKDFFLAKELDKSFIQRESLPRDSKTPVIELNNATFLRKAFSKPSNDDYDEEAAIETSRVALKNVESFKVYKGQLVCVVGRVGSGKSTFLHALMGFLPCVSGSRPQQPPSFHFRANSVALCSQQAWIMNATLKDNILFGHRYDEAYYNATVRACQLGPDLEILADGDETLVGEKGISLSGGQKARLSLARAVYSRADVYLLDDILSAVDAHVCKLIIDQVLSKSQGLLKNKTVILTTNSTSILKHSNNIYALDGGEIVESGTLDEVSKRDASSKLKALISGFDSYSKREESDDTSKEQKALVADKDVEHYDVEEDIGLVDPVEGENAVSTALQSRKASMATLRPRKIIDINADNRKTKQKEEKKERGRVKTKVYVAYLKACGISGAVIFLIFLIFSRSLLIGENFWLKHWSEDNQKNGENDNIGYYVGIYIFISLAAACFNNAKNVILLLVCSLRASRKLHDAMAIAVLRSPMSFFETTPVGRIINRFSSDMNSVDDNVQYVISFFLLSVLDYVIVIVVIGCQVPLYLVVNAALLVLYLYYQVYYVTLSRELKRLMSTSFSPIMSMLSETLAGHMVIDAFDHFERFDYLNLQNVQFNINCVFNFRSTNRWLSIRLESIGAFMILTVGLLSLATMAGDKALTAGMVGLLMSCALQVTNRLMWIVRMSVQLETNVVSVERIVEYCDLPPEAPAVIENCRPEKNWPSQGYIRFDNYSTRYRSNLDPVLKSLSLEIKPQEKIGIVGRTGAGKSTLSLALFRILEATEGAIVIDGVDISKIGLADLRTNLAIIPQDAQAFEGTVRSNLDPFEEYEDEEIWKALELSHLKPHIVKMAAEEEEGDKKGNLLETKINENGSNLSVGQRQLLCLSRALLNRSKILILDEATAAVDSETDGLIQETIRAEFKDRTILTIAHRIDTVLDSDKIMVLDRGELKEFDTPSSLLANKNSIFYNLCAQGGYLQRSAEQQ